MFEKYDLGQTIKNLQLIERIDFTLNKKDDRAKIIKTLGKMVKKYKIQHYSGSVKRAIGNANTHGEFPVEINTYFAQDRQMLVVITDQGKGFDYTSMLSKFKSGKKYYKRGGHGTRSYYKNKHSKVCWHNGGRTISILYD